MKLSSLSLVKYALAAVLTLLFGAAYSQYPATGNKQRLGWQTTGDGLVYRGAIADTSTLDPSGLNNAWMLLDTSSGNLYAYRIKAWRLVSGGGGGITMPLDSVAFNTSYVSGFPTGTMAYDADNETVSVGIDGGAIYQLGQELFYPVVINKSDSLIKNGQLVMVDTATLVQGDHVRVVQARNGANYPSNYIMGVATTDIPDDSTGLVTFFGYVREVKHADIAQSGNTLVPGNILYASPTEPGRYTNVPPSTPAHKSTIALVVRKPNPNNMTLLVRPWLAPKLEDASDVDTAGITQNSVLRYDSASGYWKASTTAGIVGSGTTNYLPKFTGANSIGNSPILNVADNQLVVGHNAVGTGAKNVLEIRGTGNTDFDGSKVDLYVNSSGQDYHSPIMSLRRSRGATAGAFTKAEHNDWLGQLLFNGADGDEYTGGAGIRAVVDSVTGNNDMPASLYFLTTPNGSSSLTTRMTINNAGRVGIGTISPGFKLSVLGADSCCGTPRISAQFRDGLNSAFYVAHTGPHPTPGYATLLGSSDDLAFGQIQSGGTSEYMRIKASTGRVGIGTTSPARSLHISATDAVRIPRGTTSERTPSGVTNANGDIRYSTTNNIVEWYDTTGNWRQPVISALPTGLGTAGRFAQFKAGGLDTSAVLIQNGDKIGIGTASPDSTLTVNGSARVTRLAVNTSGTQRLNINNYYRADQGTNGQNIWVGNGGQLLDTIGYLNKGQGANTASNNIGIGNNSLLNLRAGRDNLALGIDAGRGIIYGTYNVALGALSLATRSDGSSANVAIGNFAMQFNGTKDNTSNVAIGSNALRYNRGGNYNVALGSAALTQNVPIPSNDSAGDDGGSNNFGLGFSSCFWNGKGIANVGIGSNANYFNRNGSYNIAIGSSALAGGSSNTDTIAKNNNVVIGTEAFQYLKGNGAGNADENVAIGHQAARTFSGGSNTTAAKQGVYIGALTKPSANTNTNEIVIGYNATGNGSNTTTIGNSSTTATYIPAGSLYINGTVSPARTLHVNGEVRISDLTTDTPTRIVGADADGDLGAVTLGTGLSISSGTLNASGISSVYIPINIFAAGDTVKNTTTAKEFFLVHAGLNGYCIDSYTVKAITGTGGADIQIDKNGTGGNLQAISGTTVYTKDTNIALATGDYIRGQVFNSTGTLIGLGLTLEIKATCN